jgi:acyl carrier protein
MLNEIVRKIVERGASLWGMDMNELTDKTRFFEVGASLEQFEIIANYLEEAYKKEIPTILFEESSTIGEAAERIDEFLKNK